MYGNLSYKTGDKSQMYSAMIGKDDGEQDGGNEASAWMTNCSIIRKRSKGN